MYLKYVNYFDFSMATKFIYVNNILILAKVELVI